MSQVSGAIDWEAYAEGLVRQLLLLPVQNMHYRAMVHLRLRSHNTIVDFGCGPGNFTWALGSAFMPVRYTGLDSEPALLDRGILEARRNLRGRAAARFLGADLNRPDLGAGGLGDGEFDAAISINNLYTLRDPCRFMEGAARVVRVGGRMVVCNPGPRPDLVAILEEHLALVCSDEGPAGDELRAQEKARILTALAPALQPNEAIIARHDQHFLDGAGLRACFGPEWRPVSYEPIYGRPPQNHLFVLERVAA